MGNEKNITFVNENNLIDTIEGELLCAFEKDNVKYIVYSKNEKDFDNNMIIYFGKIEEYNNKQYVKNLDYSESLEVKDIIRKILSYGEEDRDV